jgi:hypothetical protein
VYGGSFAAMLYQDETWPDHLQKILGSDGIEVYNFSFDIGAGLSNWYGHYFHELADNYEFDMVIFAICCGALNRSFHVAETRQDGLYYGGFARPPRDVHELDRIYQPALERLQPIADRSLLARLPAHFEQHAFLALPPAPYALRSMWRVFEGMQAAAQTGDSSSVGHEAMLAEMIADIRRRGKLPILLELAWDRTRVERRAESDGTLARLAERLCADFIDGYNIFQVEDVSGYWPRYDAHWLRSGADRFAEFLAPHVLTLRSRGAPPCH